MVDSEPLHQADSSRDRCWLELRAKAAIEVLNWITNNKASSTMYCSKEPEQAVAVWRRHSESERARQFIKKAALTHSLTLTHSHSLSLIHAQKTHGKEDSRLASKGSVQTKKGHNHKERPRSQNTTCACTQTGGGKDMRKAKPRARLAQFKQQQQQHHHQQQSGKE